MSLFSIDIFEILKQTTLLKGNLIDRRQVGWSNKYGRMRQMRKENLLLKERTVQTGINLDKYQIRQSERYRWSFCLSSSQTSKLSSTSTTPELSIFSSILEALHLSRLVRKPSDDSNTTRFSDSLRLTFCSAFLSSCLIKSGRHRCGYCGELRVLQPTWSLQKKVGDFKFNVSAENFLWNVNDWWWNRDRRDFFLLKFFTEGFHRPSCALFIIKDWVGLSFHGNSSAEMMFEFQVSPQPPPVWSQKLIHRLLSALGSQLNLAPRNE